MDVIDCWEVVELVERQRLLAYPSAVSLKLLRGVMLCPHRAEQHHMAALA